jgi:hypothetical protein
MLRIDHFFQGKLSKEEVASAFLAMALEGVPGFRRHFLNLIAPKEFVSLNRKKWEVRVEVRHVDVRMDAGEIVILIENKITAGAKQKNQLLRYYKQEKRHNPDARIIMVFLAPGSIGKGEVTLVENSQEFNARTEDLAHHLSWEDLAQYTKKEDDILDEFIYAGLKEICRLIDEARLEKYSCAGDRKIIRDIVKRALNSIAEKTGVKLGHWAGRENEQIYTNNTNVTMWLDTAFKSEESPPYAPINLCNEQGLMQISIRSQFKIEGKVKLNSNLGRFWRQQVKSGFMKIPGVGIHQLQENKWFVHTQPITGSEADIEKAIVITGIAVLDTLSRKLSSAGFNLSKI